LKDRLPHTGNRLRTSQARFVTLQNMHSAGAVEFCAFQRRGHLDDFDSCRLEHLLKVMLIPFAIAAMFLITGILF
jgi:hypothetical protein